MGKFALLALILAAASASAAAPGPDPRLERELSMNVISQIDRSVQFWRVLPQVERVRKPRVDEGDMLQVQDGVYLDRRLVPPPPGPEDREPAVRVYRRDVR